LESKLNEILPVNCMFIRDTSGVARVLCALGQEIVLRPLSSKTTEFEVKNSCKNLEDEKFVLF